MRTISNSLCSFLFVTQLQQSCVKYYRSSGSVLVQLVSVPVRGLPDVSFVYGLLHLYRDSSAGGKGTRGSATPFGGGSAPVKLEAGFPLQGRLL